MPHVHVRLICQTRPRFPHPFQALLCVMLSTIHHELRSSSLRQAQLGLIVEPKIQQK